MVRPDSTMQFLLWQFATPPAQTSLFYCCNEPYFMLYESLQKLFFVKFLAMYLNLVRF